MVADNEYLLRFDGGSRGNPGISGCGFVIYDPLGGVVLKTSATVGMHATNNEAEYHGLLMALCAISNNDNIERIRIEGDSMLVINQLKGLWKVKAENLRIKHDQVSPVSGHCHPFIPLKRYKFACRTFQNYRAGSLHSPCVDRGIIFLFGGRRI